MKPNENIVSGKWTEIKGEIQKSWGKLTDNELEQTKGDMKAIGGLLQQKYGEAQDSFGKTLREIFERFDMKKDAKVDEVKHTIKETRI